jgi:hypothetical protein
MFYVVIFLALVILAAFAGVWFKDRRRTHEQAGDGERLDP